MNIILEERARKYPILMLDVYAGNIWNPEEEKARGVRGVICKAGQGGYYSLPKNFIVECERVGLAWGLYWLIDSRYDSSYHMRAIKAAFPGQNFGPLGWWWDMEKPRITMPDREYRKTRYAGNGLIESVIGKFTSWTGKPGGAYTSPGFAALLGWSSALFKLKSLYPLLAGMHLWVAQYNDFIAQPSLFGPWKTWLWWQYQEGPDYNYFNGTEEDFKNLIDGYVPNAPIPQTKYTGTVISSTGVNVRTGPGIGYTKFGVLPRYTAVRGEEVAIHSNAEAWLHITSPTEGWIAIRHNWQTLVSVEE